VCVLILMCNSNNINNINDNDMILMKWIKLLMINIIISNVVMCVLMCNM